MLRQGGSLAKKKQLRSGERKEGARLARERYRVVEPFFRSGAGGYAWRFSEGWECLGLEERVEDSEQTERLAYVLHRACCMVRIRHLYTALNVDKSIVMSMKDLSLSSLRAFLGDLSDVVVGSWGNTEIGTPFKTKPHDFLRFAEYDLGNKYEHHLSNALSNVKRAIDCQLDSLLVGFGLYDEAKSKKLSFPKKVILLNSFGVISPSILKRINQKRNLLEHEYVRPAKDDVEDAFDVANLFIVYTDKYVLKALESCDVCDNDMSDCFHISMDYKKKSLILSHDTMKKCVKAGDLEYYDYLKLFLSLYEIAY